MAALTHNQAYQLGTALVISYDKGQDAFVLEGNDHEYGVSIALSHLTTVCLRNHTVIIQFHQHQPKSLRPQTSTIPVYIEHQQNFGKCWRVTHLDSDSIMFKSLEDKAAKYLDQELNMEVLGNKFLQAILRKDTDKVHSYLEVGINLTCFVYKGNFPVKESDADQEKGFEMAFYRTSPCENRPEHKLGDCHNDVKKPFWGHNLKYLFKDFNTKRYTPLHITVMVNHLPITKLLTDAGARPVLKDVDGNTALHLACTLEFHAQLPTLLRSCRPQDLDIKNAQGNTALHLMISLNKLERVKELCEAGANKELKSADGFMPLQQACTLRHHQIVEYLLQSGVEVDTLDSNGRTALHLVALFPNTQCASSLLKHHADVNKRDNNGCTPLFLSVETSPSNAINQTLILNGADPFIKNKTGLSPAILAARKKSHVKLLKSFLEANIKFDDEEERKAVINELYKEAQAADNIEAMHQLFKYLPEDAFKEKVCEVLNVATINHEYSTISRCIAAMKDAGMRVPGYIIARAITKGPHSINEHLKIITCLLSIPAELTNIKDGKSAIVLTATELSSQADRAERICILLFASCFREHDTDAFEAQLGKKTTFQVLNSKLSPLVARQFMAAYRRTVSAQVKAVEKSKDWNKFDEEESEAWASVPKELPDEEQEKLTLAETGKLPLSTEEGISLVDMQTSNEEEDS
ncbi:ankyrin repeat domain-containing protein [Parashewanella tropica]|uniref:ankyrin repeat domain-containing protein n=1 Tax=Parashewanella tropica TaxID=2547970 RepID=UPI00105A3B17|nr:ankyrin repeat domain-containing protein [Parashewanella tropica]